MHSSTNQKSFSSIYFNFLETKQGTQNQRSRTVGYIQEESREVCNRGRRISQLHRSQQQREMYESKQEEN